MNFFGELSMALSYGRHSDLPAAKVTELSQIEHEISVAKNDTDVINALYRWAAGATSMDVAHHEQ
jgi:hypothetical protein